MWAFLWGAHEYTYLLSTIASIEIHNSVANIRKPTRRDDDPTSLSAGYSALYSFKFLSFDKSQGLCQFHPQTVFDLLSGFRYFIEVQHSF
jgi:hypothetical protein